MKKILIIGPFPEPINGCSLANDVLLNNLIKQGFNVSTINTAVNLISSKQGTEFSIKKVFNFLKTYLLISKICYSNVVYTTPGQTFFGILKYAPFYICCILLKKPYIIHVHGNYLGKEYRRLLGFKKYLFGYFIRKSSAGIVLSESLRNNFDGLLENVKVHVIKNFVQKEFTSIEVAKKDDKLRILYLSNIMLEKGIFELLDSLKFLSERGTDFELVIAGKVEKGIEDFFKQTLSSFGDNVKYIGTVYGKEKKEVLVNANMFVLPTYYSMEGQPISILEALATGNIIISTKHGGIPDIISDNNGFLIEPKSVEQLTDILTKVSSNLPNYIDKFSFVNVEYVKRNFTEDNFTFNIIDVINEVSKFK